MSCSTDIPVSQLVAEINAHLDTNYIDKEDPRITQGVFTEPTIRGGMILDEASKADFCDIVASCGQEAPFGKVWISRPLYAGSTLVSYLEAGEVETRWEAAQTTAKGATPARPEAPAVGQLYLDTTLAPAGKPVWWTGTAWVDSMGEEV